jgi:hypothetical protein
LEENPTGNNMKHFSVDNVTDRKEDTPPEMLMARSHTSSLNAVGF